MVPIIKDVSYDSLHNRKDVFIILVNTKHKNIKKLALVFGATLGAVVIGTQAANADTQIDSNHVRVEQGDTISAIAQKHNVSVDSLVQANHLSNPDMIFVGDTLVLTPNASDSNTTTQTPSDGDSQHMYQPVHMIENNENNASNASNASNENNNQPATNTATTQQSAPVATSTTGGSSADTIAQAESGGSYTAQNGRYYGKYQLDLAYLGGDLSPQHQEEVFQQYCNQRYGSVGGALSFRQSHGWY